MLLSIKNLTISVSDPTHEKILVKGLNLDIPENRIVSLVGGSGCGKTTTGLSILRLLPPALSVKNGEIFFKGDDLLKFSEKKMQKLRGQEISMIFQEPLNAFNPVFSIGYQIDEVLQVHSDLVKSKRKEKILDILNIVGLDDPQRVCNNYPHQLSGGMRQRAMIAQALAVDPALVIADEPTSNLDVTLQAKIIELFKKLKHELNLSILLITHDLGMVEHLADEIAIVYEGEVVEFGHTKDVLANPQHLFTNQLMETLKS